MRPRGAGTEGGGAEDGLAVGGEIQRPSRRAVFRILQVEQRVDIRLREILVPQRGVGKGVEVEHLGNVQVSRGQSGEVNAPASAA